MGAAAIPLAGGVFSAIGSLSQADEDSQSLNDEAAVNDKNAAIARSAGKYNADRQQNKAEQIFGSIKTDYAASGVEADSGSVLETLRQSHVNAELDRQNILYGAEVKAINFENAARAGRAKASNIQNNKTTNAFLSLFGAGSKYMGSGGSGAKATPAAGGDYGSTNGGGYGSAGESAGSDVYA